MARQKGLEPLTYCLEGSCSIQLSYWRISSGAGDGNRTRVSSLEGWCSTIELHPQIHLSAVSALGFYHEKWKMSSLLLKNLRNFFINHIGDSAVGAFADVFELLGDDCVRGNVGEVRIPEHG